MENLTKIMLNPDQEIVLDIRERLKVNDGYCPCSTVRTPDTKCICKEFKEMDEGECHCGLYIKRSVKQCEQKEYRGIF